MFIPHFMVFLKIRQVYFFEMYSKTDRTNIINHRIAQFNPTSENEGATKGDTSLLHTLHNPVVGISYSPPGQKPASAFSGHEKWREDDDDVVRPDTLRGTFSHRF